MLQRRAARPGDRPARHRSCAPDQSDACLGGRPRRKVLHASPPPGRHRTAPHGRSWSHDAAHQRRTHRRASGTPITSGSGAACPTGPGGPAIPWWGAGHGAAGIAEAADTRHEGLPRRKATGAAHRAPAPVGRASPAGPMRAAVRRRADRLVGVGRRPTRRPEGPGMGVRRPAHGPSYQGQRSRCGRLVTAPTVGPSSACRAGGRRAASLRPTR